MKVHVNQKNQDGKSILAQVSKVVKNRGLVVVTFWWNNTATSMDGFGNMSRFVHADREAMRVAYRGLVEAGYAPVEVLV